MLCFNRFFLRAKVVRNSWWLFQKGAVGKQLGEFGIGLLAIGQLSVINIF
jgi:hypothetical protein